MATEADPYRVVDFGDKVSYLTLDVISEVSYGQSFGFIENDMDMYGYLAQARSSLFFQLGMTTMPYLHRIKDTLLSAFMPKDSDGYGLGFMAG